MADDEKISLRQYRKEKEEARNDQKEFLKSLSGLLMKANEEQKNSTKILPENSRQYKGGRQVDFGAVGAPLKSLLMASSPMAYAALKTYDVLKNVQIFKNKPAERSYNEQGSSAKVIPNSLITKLDAYISYKLRSNKKMDSFYKEMLAKQKETLKETKGSSKTGLKSLASLAKIADMTKLVGLSVAGIGASLVLAYMAIKKIHDSLPSWIKNKGPTVKAVDYTGVPITGKFGELRVTDDKGNTKYGVSQEEFNAAANKGWKTRTHTGVDFALAENTPVTSPVTGKIKHAGPMGDYGIRVEILFNKSRVVSFSHLSKVASNIVVGREVKVGDIIGYVGSTGRSSGAHLHVEVYAINDAGEIKEYFDPAQSLLFKGVSRKDYSSVKSLTPVEVASYRKGEIPKTKKAPSAGNYRVDAYTYKPPKATSKNEDKLQVNQNKVELEKRKKEQEEKRRKEKEQAEQANKKDSINIINNNTSSGNIAWGSLNEDLKALGSNSRSVSVM